MLFAVRNVNTPTLVAISLEILLQHLSFIKRSGPTDATINNIVCDSRSVRPGSLFVAIPGTKMDGHHFISAAIEKGAVAIVGEQIQGELASKVSFIEVEDSRKALSELACAYYDFPTQKLFTMGVTGTNGKTSITFLAQSVLNREKTAVSNTVINSLDHGLDYTTPDALVIQQLAYEALRQQKENLVLEVSAHALSQERVHGIDFSLAIFTNLTQDHFDYYDNFQDYLNAKLKLFQNLSKDSLAIINGDDAYACHFMENTSAKIWTYGLAPKYDLWAEDIHMNAEGTQFLAHTPSGSMQIQSAMPGEFYIYNILAAMAVGLAKGISLEQIKKGIESVRQIAGRFERFKTADNISIVIDFAHSPDSLEKMIHTLKKFYPRVTAVFGCGGESDPYKRPIMGKISGQYADYTIITNDNPKHENPASIIQQIESGVLRTKKPYEAIPDRPQAILRALALARPGDCVLIAGKGHERTQIFDQREVAFNDREFLKQMRII